MNGFILLDKPEGITCARIDQLVKKWSGEKTAHVGTLDPNVSGVLPLLIGKKAIKLLEYLQQSEKEYICLMKVNAEKQDIEKLLEEFTGKVYQKPPKLSAVSKKIRVRKIYRTRLLDSEGDYFLFQVTCQHGTYIRTLVKDIGRVLGKNAKMIELRRTRSNGFKEPECVPLIRVKDALELNAQGKKGPEGVLLPLEETVRSLPKVIIKDSAAKNVIKGAPLMAPGIIKVEGHVQKDKTVAILTEDRQLLAVGRMMFDKGNFPERGIITKTEKVILEKL